MSHRVRFTPAGDGARLNTVDSTATVKVTSRETDGQYELFEIEAPQGPGVPLHRHPWPEAYYGLDGTLRVQVGARQFDIEPGGSLTVPPNVAHAIEAVTPTARFLAFSLTPGTGRLFEDLDRTIPAGEPDPATIPLLIEVAERNQVAFVGGPPA
jgi:quercetin dioxygenase-like cupin family protein